MKAHRNLKIIKDQKRMTFFDDVAPPFFHASFVGSPDVDGEPRHEGAIPSALGLRSHPLSQASRGLGTGGTGARPLLARFGWGNVHLVLVSR